MNCLLALVLSAYSRILNLYPRKFKDEFAVEMNHVFRSSVIDAAEAGGFPLLVVCGRELLGLPFNILQEFWHEIRAREAQPLKSKTILQAAWNGQSDSASGAWIGTLPFLLFGLVSMLTKIETPFNDADFYLSLYLFVFAGLFWGLAKGVPCWTYIYLAWSLILTWWPWWLASWASWWIVVSTQELNILGIEINHPGWQVWIPLFAVFGGAVVLKRSLSPLRQLVKSAWQDWTLLSMAMYTFIAFLILLYEDNHSPYLILFIFATTLAVCASVWAFMKSAKSLNRFMALLAGFVAGVAINRISESTWDMAAYYGLPPGPATPWYDSILGWMALSGFWTLILLLPALMGFVRRAIRTD